MAFTSPLEVVKQDSSAGKTGALANISRQTKSRRKNSDRSKQTLHLSPLPLVAQVKQRQPRAAGPGAHQGWH